MGNKLAFERDSLEGIPQPAENAAISQSPATKRFESEELNGL
jgi:hypothetical protein